MKRFFFFFALFFAVAQLPLHAQTPTSPLIPTGVQQAVATANVAVPGITCGIAGDPDPIKAQCCAPKKDTSVLKDVLDKGSSFIFVGYYIGGVRDAYQSLTSLGNNLEPCDKGSVPSTPNDYSNPACICVKDANLSTTHDLNSFCTQYFSASLNASNNNEIQRCSKCMMESPGGFYTSLGCIPLSLSSFITNYILGTGIGIAGGIALLCIIYSAFRMQTSMGNPEAIKKAQENLTACITGLIIIIFSVLILKIIGVDILRIPSL